MNRRSFLRLLPAPLLALLPWPVQGNVRSSVPFADVEGRWGELVNDLKARGLVAGVGDDEFAPHRALTRAEAAVLICRLAGLEPDFRDDDVHWGAKWTRAASNAGFMVAELLWIDSDLLYHAVHLDTPATRADVAVILALALMA